MAVSLWQFRALPERAAGHRRVTDARYCEADFERDRPAMSARQAYDDATIAILRRALDDILIDRIFLESRSVSALEIAEHILAQAARGERDLRRIKASVLEYLADRSEKSAA